MLLNLGDPVAGVVQCLPAPRAGEDQFGAPVGEVRQAFQVATLAVAALFQPARRRIQAAVDRRFNRRRYETTKTIEAFSARLRHHVDLDSLTSELLEVVDQTMEPTKASLWLRRSTK